jgi:D-alanine transaminase
MHDLIHLDGRFVPLDEAAISPLDRGLLFGEGVYEVVRYQAGQALHIDRHLARLRDSLRGIELAAEVDHLPGVSDELVRRLGLDAALVYWQITRGPVGPRKHAVEPAADVRPTVLMMAQRVDPVTPQQPLPRVRLITRPETRWTECWIKSTLLLPNTLAKTAAARAGAAEAVFVRDGRITEGASTSVLTVIDSAIHVHPLDGRVLPGITRGLLLEAADAMDLPIIKRAPELQQVHTAATELLICGTGTLLAAATHLDDHALPADHAPIGERLWTWLRKRITAPGRSDRAAAS